MKKEKIKVWFLPLLLGAAQGMEILLLFDILVVFLGKTIHPLLGIGLWILLTAGIGCLIGWNSRRMLRILWLIPLILAVLLGSGCACWLSFGNNAGYAFPDTGKNQIYGNRTVMLVVPHQDDDLNILGGVLEEYVRYGSDLYPVFVTNGDYAHLTQTRYQEALAVFQHLGVQTDQVTFLGYGNEWKEGGVHIYNASSGEILESYAGQTKTYGTKQHPAYHEGRPYTVDNLTEDLKSIILEVKPDVIFCSEYDHHIDHKAVTLLFDKVMGQILKDNPDYSPIVYKAYAYGTAWEAEQDYYADNILSTRNLFEEPYGQWPAVYRWEDRIRFPVSGTELSQSLVTSGNYKMLKYYASQGAHKMAASVINGDKVAWQRRTDSLCLRAEMSVSSGEEKVLHDFMLIENLNLISDTHRPYDGVWIPEKDDPVRSISVILERPSDLDSLALYDHPAPEHNVSNALITLDDGTTLETGALNPDGAATLISVGKKKVSSFCITLLETEGDRAGLSEVEAYAEAYQPDGGFLKLMDGEGNFLYDYQIQPGGTGELSLYLWGNLPEVSEENYFINTDSETASAVLENGIIRVSCPPGEEFILRAVCNEAGISDSILVRNPGMMERNWTRFWQWAEQAVYTRYSQNIYQNLMIPSTWTKISYVFRHLG